MPAGAVEAYDSGNHRRGFRYFLMDWQLLVEGQSTSAFTPDQLRSRAEQLELDAGETLRKQPLYGYCICLQEPTLASRT